MVLVGHIAKGLDAGIGRLGRAGRKLLAVVDDGQAHARQLGLFARFRGSARSRRCQTGAAAKVDVAHHNIQVVGLGHLGDFAAAPVHIRADQATNQHAHASTYQQAFGVVSTCGLACKGAQHTAQGNAGVARVVGARVIAGEGGLEGFFQAYRFTVGTGGATGCEKGNGQDDAGLV